MGMRMQSGAGLAIAIVLLFMRAGVPASVAREEPSEHASTAQGRVGIEYDTNRPGFDYSTEELSRPDPGECQAACERDAKCRAYTYVKPGVQGRTARCYLKSSVPRPVSDRCCVSGVKSRSR
jgi:hypothetical protein